MVEPAPGEIRQESRREYDPTMIAEDDPELLEEFEGDTLQPIIKGDVLPRVKITTEVDNQEFLIPFGEILAEMIPNAVFAHRENYDFDVIRKDAIEEGFTELIVLVGANSKVHSLYQLHLPYGPSANWRITSIVMPKEIPGHSKTSQHYPEVIMKRFETRLGRQCSRMLRALFPAEPQYNGRRVMTFHHQRDFIFFRHYRYIFDSVETARMQESGPRFTLKLIWLQEGPYDPSSGQYTYYRRQRHETSRRKWDL